MKIAALLTGKGTSTLANKNILPVGGRPLAFYPARAAAGSHQITRYYASSDSEALLNIAAELGYRRIRRPDALCRPESLHVDAILHALEIMRTADGYEPDVLVVLLANTVSVLTSWIDEGIRMICDDPTISAVVPVYREADHHPFRAKRVNADGLLEPFVDFWDGPVSTNRQDLEPCFFLCHNFWVLNLPRSVYAPDGQPPWDFMGDRIKPMEVGESVDVHDAEDIARCELWLAANPLTPESG